MTAPKLIIAALALVKGVVMAVLILAVSNSSFAQSLILAITSAFVSGAFLLAATWLQIRHTTRKVDEVKQQVEDKIEEVAHES